MGGPKIELDKAFWTRVQEHAEAAGYSSPEEFVQHVIERELVKTESAETPKRRRQRSAASAISTPAWISSGRNPFLTVGARIEAYWFMPGMVNFSYICAAFSGVTMIDSST